MSKTELHPAEYIQLDLFPAAVTEAGKDLGYEIRVIVTDNYLYVFRDEVEGPEAFIALPLDSFDGSNKIGYTVTSDDRVFSIARAKNCGCGSRLRGFRPFGGVPHITHIEKG